MSHAPTKWFALQHRYAPYLFVAPFLVVFLAFGVYPIAKSVLLSFYITSGPTSQVWAGLANFRFLISDPDFHKAVANTATFAAASVTIQLPLALGLALVVNAKGLWLRNTFRLCLFSPRLVGMVFVGILFGLVFAPRFGLLNAGLNALLGNELAPLDRTWLNDPRWVMPCLVLTALWLYTGHNMIYFLAALQGVDETLYEAARIDGANAWQQFLHVTLPGIKPVAVFVVIMSVIGSFQLFELAYLLLSSGSGPEGAGLTIVMYLYQNGFVTGDLGYASAIGWTLAAGVLVLSLGQMYLSGTLRKGVAQ